MPHVASYTDFLLVRMQAGNIALREITGCVAVGQQHPSVPIWSPGSEQAVAYERARFKVRVPPLQLDWAAQSSSGQQRELRTTAAAEGMVHLPRTE